METMKNKKPLVVYDGDCAFCKAWVGYSRHRTKSKVNYEPFQKLSKDYSHIPLSDFKKSVQLIDRDEKIYSGAEAIYRILRYGSGWMWKVAVWKYKKVPGFAGFSEWMYRVVVNHRSFFFKLARPFLKRYNIDNQ
jgi:predicted DCC family thiol-disulfide oxidoreductase YuxK